MPTWLETILGDTTALQLIFWVVAIVSLLAVVLRIWPVLSKAVTIINAVSGLPAFIARTDEKIDQIHHETHYNDGSSMKDALERLEEGVAGLYTTTEALGAADTEMRQELENTRPKPPKGIEQ